MTNQHPLTPPDELLEKWYLTAKFGNCRNALTFAYRAGADQELEACVEWLDQSTVGMADLLREYRRSEPPTLKERIAAAITAGDEHTALSLLNEALPNG